jgi:rubrerythrin
MAKQKYDVSGGSELKKRPPSTKPKGKGKGKKYAAGILEDADPNYATMRNEAPPGAAKTKKDTRLKAEDYEEAAGYLGDFKNKVKDKIIKIRLDDLIEKFEARAKKIRETTRAPGSTHQRTKAQKYRCKTCNHEFKTPTKKLHCPNPECDSTNLEQLKITDFRTEDEELRAVTAL